MMVRIFRAIFAPSILFFKPLDMSRDTVTLETCPKARHLLERKNADTEIINKGVTLVQGSPMGAKDKCTVKIKIVPASIDMKVIKVCIFRALIAPFILFFEILDMSRETATLETCPKARRLPGGGNTDAEIINRQAYSRSTLSAWSSTSLSTHLRHPTKRLALPMLKAFPLLHHAMILSLSAFARWQSQDSRARQRFQLPNRPEAPRCLRSRGPWSSCEY